MQITDDLEDLYFDATGINNIIYLLKLFVHFFNLLTQHFHALVVYASSILEFLGNS